MNLADEKTEGLVPSGTIPELTPMLTPDCYTDQQWFEREVQSIHRPAWHFTCLASSLKEPGSYVTRRLLGRSVVVVKGDDGIIRAFLNTCRHRGAPLTQNPCGQLNQFKCPFHEWRYDTCGVLLNAPGLGGLERSDLVRLGLGLISVECGVEAGFVFVNLRDSKAESLRDYLGTYIESVAIPHQSEQMLCTHSSSYVLKTNWKLYIEVDMETLHTNFIHSRSIGSQPVTALAHSENWFGVYSRSNLTPALFPEKKHRAFPIPDTVRGDAREGTHFCVILPGFFVVSAPEVMWWIQKTPISASETHVSTGYCFHKETVKRHDFEERAKLYKERLDRVIFEDDQITEFQFEGLQNGIQGFFTPMEPVAAYFARLVKKRVDHKG